MTNLYDTPFKLSDGRILVIRSGEPFPEGKCPYQVKDAAIFTEKEYERFLAAQGIEV